MSLTRNHRQDRERIAELSQRLWARYSDTHDSLDLRSAEDMSELASYESLVDRLSSAMQKLAVSSILLLHRFKSSRDEADYHAVLLLVDLARRLTRERPMDAPIWLHALKIAQDMQSAIITASKEPNETSAEPPNIMTLLFRRTADELHKSLLSVLLCTVRAGPSKVDESCIEGILGPIFAEAEDSDNSGRIATLYPWTLLKQLDTLPDGETTIPDSTDMEFTIDFVVPRYVYHLT